MPAILEDKSMAEAYLWAIVFLPLAGALVNGLFGKRLGRGNVAFIAIAMLAGSFLLSLMAFSWVMRGEGVILRFGGPGWFRVLGPDGRALVSVSWGLLVDRLSGTMILVVTGVGFLIHVYSASYMSHEDDGGYARYFTYLNLFVAAMLILVLGDSLALTFVGWEGVGLCSYLLIGFWYTDEQKAYCGRKAFVVNRIGDFGFLIGFFSILSIFGTADYGQLAEAARRVQGSTVLASGPFAGWTASQALTFATVGFFVGCAGKSAQLPLYVWLPDAMAGPTPVSALIHAATLVTAGVYMVARLNFVYALSPTAMGWVALVGAVTAIFSASIGFLQYDIKKVLAYSTVSQLGFMFIGVGLGAWWAGAYHLLTHAFFKACLFLGAGSVILGCHHEQDMRKMGGLKKLMPITAATYLVACWAIAGYPWAAGFYPKDEILWKAFTSQHLALLGRPAPWLGQLIYLVGIVAATGTAFYMFRSYYLTFTGEYRGGEGHDVEHDEDPHSALAAPHHATAAHPRDGADEARRKAHDLHAHAAAAHPAAPAQATAHDDRGHGHHGGTPRESPLSITFVLVVLAAGSVLAGLLGLPMLWTHRPPALEHFLEPSIPAVVRFAEKPHSLEWLFQGIGVAAGVVGWLFARLLYKDGRSRVPHDLKKRFVGLWTVVYNKYYVDEAYHALVVRPSVFFARFLSWFDQHVIDWAVNFAGWVTRFFANIDGAIDKYLVDGAVNAVANVTIEGGRALRRVQTGHIQTYLYGALAGALAVVLLNFLIG